MKPRKFSKANDRLNLFNDIFFDLVVLQRFLHTSCIIYNGTLNKSENVTYRQKNTRKVMVQKNTNAIMTARSISSSSRMLKSAVRNDFTWPSQKQWRFVTFRWVFKGILFDCRPFIC